MNSATYRDTGPNLTRLTALAFLLGIVPQAITEAAITATLPEAAKDFGGNGEFAAQMLMLTGMLGLVFGALFSGQVLERLGSRRTYVWSAILFAIVGSAGLFLQNTGLLFASRVLTGFAASCIATTAMWGVAAQFERDARPKSFGYAGAIGGTLAIASVIVGGYLTQHFGWRSAFAQFVIVGVVLLPIALGGVAQTKPAGIRRGEPGHFRRLLLLFVQNFMLYAVIGVFSVQLPFLLDAAGLTDAGVRSLIQAVPGIGVIVGGALFGLLAKRLGIKGTLCLTVLPIIAGFMFVSVDQGLVALATCSIGAGICMGLAMPWFYTALSRKTPAGVVARYMGYLSAFTFIGSFSNPFWAQPLKTAIGISGLFATCAAIATAMLIFNLVTIKQEDTP